MPNPSNLMAQAMAAPCAGAVVAVLFNALDLFRANLQVRLCLLNLDLSKSQPCFLGAKKPVDRYYAATMARRTMADLHERSSNQIGHHAHDHFANARFLRVRETIQCAFRIAAHYSLVNLLQ